MTLKPETIPGFAGSDKVGIITTPDFSALHTFLFGHFDKSFVEFGSATFELIEL